MWDSWYLEHNLCEVCLMKYSIRTELFQYTTYLPFNRCINKPYNITNISLINSLMEELYDHHEDHWISLINRELVNVARSSKYSDKLKEMYNQLILFLKDNFEKE